jgi:AcrR family transcriptional regulator
MTVAAGQDSARKLQLIAAAYDYVSEHGLADMSLRPLAEAIGSSPRVLLYLFGSKDGLVGALLAQARAQELELLDTLRAAPAGQLAEVGGLVWSWLSAPEHRGLLVLWAESYARSLVDPVGPWSGFARRTVTDWLDVFAAAQPAAVRQSDGGAAERTLLLAVLRGALLDLLATGDTVRTTDAVTAHLSALSLPGSEQRVVPRPDQL